MSERGSFVTEYIYCQACLEKLTAVLLRDDKFLTGTVIDGWAGGPDQLPIIAGKIGGLSPGSELVAFEFDLFNKKNAPCHPVRVAVLPDEGGGRLFVVHPDGYVQTLAEWDATAV